MGTIGPAGGDLFILSFLLLWAFSEADINEKN